MAPRGPTPAPPTDGETHELLRFRLDRVEDRIDVVEKHAHETSQALSSLFAECAKRDEQQALERAMTELRSRVDQAEGASKALRWFVPVATSVLIAILTVSVTVAIRLWGRG